MTAPRLRPATAADSPAIARLFLISSDGIAAYIWSRMAGPGETLEQTGARRYARTGTAFSFESCLLAEQGGQIVGMAHSYPMDPDPAAAPETDPVLRPYSELEDFGSLYLAGLAVDEALRGRGLGGRLLDAVEARASQLGRPRVSLICFERNLGAMRLYARRGYRALARRPIVPHPSLHYTGGDAVLLAREVGSP